MTLTDKRKIMEQSSKVKSIIEWCKEQHENQGELKLVWEGGGDSGWAHFEIDNCEVDNEYTRALVDRIDDVLDYGSWAGEFSANGEAIYDPETRTFSGIDSYNENEMDVIDSNITIKVPKTLWFNTLMLECEANYDEQCSISARLIIKNGFLTDEHLTFCKELETLVEEEVDTLFTEYGEIQSCNDIWALDRDNAVDDGENLVFTIKQVNVSIRDEQEIPIVLELDEETAAAIDKKLNTVHERD